MLITSDVTARLFKPLHLDPADRLRLTLESKRDGSKPRFICEVYKACEPRPPYNESVAGPSAAARYDFPRRLPERKELNARWPMIAFEAPATDLTVELANELWTQDKIIFADDETRTTFQYILLRSKLADKIAETNAQFKFKKLVPQDDYEVHDIRPLVPYQRVALNCAMNSEGFGLLMEQGTGKTPVAIATACNVAKRVKATENRPARIIIVAPKNVRLNWESEFEAFTTQPGIITVLRGTQMYRIGQLVDAFTFEGDEAFTVVIMSYETMVRTWDILKKIDWDLAVLDESHYIKTPDAKRTKYTMKLRDKSHKRMLLTGTPITNSPLDIYTQLEFLEEGGSGFTNFEAFKRFYGVFELTQAGYEKLVGMQNLPFMQERLTRTTFAIRKSEAMPDLPPKTYDIVEVGMTKDQTEIYENVCMQIATEIENELEHGEFRQLQVNNILTRLLRLAQITSGFVAYDEVTDDEGTVLSPKGIQPFAPNLKIEALLEMLKEKGPNDKTLVWACFVPNIHMISAALTAAGIKHCTYYGSMNDEQRAKAEHDFNFDPECKVLVGNPAAGGVGLNLLGYPPGTNGEGTQTRCNHEIYFSQNWSAVQRAQSEDRAHRRGTLEPVRITDLCVPGTIDQEIRDRVLTKRRVASEIGDVRQILSAILEGLKNVRDDG